jgi:uncharacterized protein YjiK
MFKLFPSFLILITLFTGCKMNQNGYEDDKSNYSFSGYDLSDEKAEGHILPKILKEISGSAFHRDGRFFCHDDELGIIYHVDHNRGNIIKSFQVGEKLLKKDFEGMEIIGDKFYLVTSSGEIYECEEAEDGGFSDYNVYKTFLTTANDVEGLCYDPETNSLLLACKDYPGIGYAGSRAIYTFSLDEYKLAETPVMLIDLKLLKDKYNLNRFSPSGLTYNAKNNSFFVTSAHEKSILELSRESKILDFSNLLNKFHNQPESISITPDERLLISDEGGGFTPATLTIYPLKK